MRLFRPTYKGKDGKSKKVSKFWIELRDHLYTVRRFPAFADKGQSELLGRQIERLINYKVAGEQPDARLSRWLEGVPEKLRDRFVSIGLLDASRAAAGKSLREHVEDFKQSLISKDNTERYISISIGRLRRTIDGCKFKTWGDISASKVQRYLADLRNIGEGLSVQTSNFYLAITKQFCRWMITDRRASESPLEHLRGLNARTDRRHDRRALEPDEIRRLLEATRAAPERFLMTGHERALLYRLAIETGLRADELRSLTTSSFDLGACTVTVEAAYAKNRKESTLPVRKATADLLKSFVAGKLPHTKVFKKITTRTADMLKADLADAGIPYVDDAGRYADFHSLRHTFGSLLAASGVHPKTAQDLMRHSDINLTMSRYTHTLRGQGAEAVESLPDLSQPSSENQAAVRTGTGDLAENSLEHQARPITPPHTTDRLSNSNPPKNTVAGLNVGFGN